MVVVARPNVIGATILQLRSFSELTALCGAGSPRINGAKQVFWNPMPRTAIWVRGTGGPPSGDWGELDRLHARISLYCYGSTELTAYELWMMADACFCPTRKSGLPRSFTRIATPNGCRVEDVERAAGPFNLIEPETEWPLTWADYLLRYVGIPV